MVKRKEPEKKRRKEIDDPILKDVMRRVAKNLRRLRGETTQQELGSQAHLAASTISEIEQERAYNVKVHTLISIANVLNVDVIDILK